MMRIGSSVPVLQVADVERSINWYASVFGFESDPFPGTPPYSFAILRRDRSEIMLQCSDDTVCENSRRGWSVYLRIEGGELLEFAKIVREHTELAREPERIFYGQVEFDVVDPDGHVICVAEALPAEAKVRHARGANVRLTTGWRPKLDRPLHPSPGQPFAVKHDSFGALDSHLSSTSGNPQEMGGLPWSGSVSAFFPMNSRCMA